MISEQVVQIVNEIALKLGVAAEKVYPMLIKQAEVKSATYHVTLWIAGIAMVLLLASVWLAFSKKSRRLGFETIGIGLMCMSGIMFMIAGCEMAFELQDFVTARVNPEWYAIKYVLDLIKLQG